MTKKVVFFDIDDTLYNTQKELPESTKIAIQRLQKDGHKTVIATGRSPMMFKSLIEELDIDTFVSMNGQFVVAEGEVIFKNPLNESIFSELVESVDTTHAPMIYLNNENMKSQIEHHPHYDLALDTLQLPYTYQYEPDFYKTNEVFQGLIFADEAHSKNYVEQYKEYFHFIRWHEYCLDVLPKGGSKALGIEHLIKHLGVDVKDTIAFGDGPNDHEMLQMVGVGVAMGNASDALKRDADYITSHVDNDGVMDGLVALGLIKENG